MKNRRALFLFILLAALLVAGCTDTPTDAISEIPNSEPDCVADPDHPGCQDDGGTDDGGTDSSGKVTLDITIRDAAADSILSDSGGVYHNGPVQAIIFEIGNFSFWLKGSHRRAMLAFGDYSWSDTLDVIRVSTGDPSVGGGFPELAPGDTMSTRSQITWVADGYNWFLRYGRDCGRNDVNENRAIVIRNADGSWTYEAMNAYLCSLSIRGPSEVLFEGEFKAPFGMTLVKQQ